MVISKNSQPDIPGTYRFTIPRATLSDNKFKGREGHWAYQADKKEWVLLVSIYAKGIPIATGKRKLTIERHGHRILDYGNFVAGCKSLVDALVNHHAVYKVEGKKRVKVSHGLLIDDRHAWVEEAYSQHKVLVHFKEYTVIVLEDLSNGD